MVEEAQTNSQVYGLARLVLGSHDFAPISESNYTAIKTAHDYLRILLSIENRFDIVVENLCEFETELVVLATRDMIHVEADSAALHTGLRVINRRFVNLLASGATYIATIPKALKQIAKLDENITFDSETEFSTQYDMRLGYRAIVAIRNYALHYGDPVHVLTYNRNWIETDQAQLLRFAVTPCLKPKLLYEDSSFKRAMLHELENEGENIDIKHLVRDFVAGVSIVHQKIRDNLQQSTEVHEKCYHEAIKNFMESCPDNNSTLGLSAVKRKNDEKFYSSNVDISLNVITSRESLIRKNRNLANIGKRYASGEIVSKQK